MILPAAGRGHDHRAGRFLLGSRAADSQATDHEAVVLVEEEEVHQTAGQRPQVARGLVPSSSVAWSASCGRGSLQRPRLPSQPTSSEAKPTRVRLVAAFTSFHASLTR
jgi:hypothetical protein